MNRLFGKGKTKEPPPNLTDCIANVDSCFIQNVHHHSVDVQFPVHLNDPPSLPQFACDGDSPRMTAVTMSLALGWTMSWTRKLEIHVTLTLSLYHDQKLSFKLQQIFSFSH